MLTTISGMNGSSGIVHGAIRLSDDDRTDEELLDDLDCTEIEGVEALIREIGSRIRAVKEAAMAQNPILRFNLTK